MTTPVASCPLCQGKGESLREWNHRKGVYETILRPCILCYAEFEQVHRFTEELILQYSGKGTLGYTPESIDECTRGDDARLYARLLSWLWAHPPDSGQDRNGFPKGQKPIKARPLPRIYNPKPKKRRGPKMEFEGPRFIPWFAADVKPLLDAWSQISKQIKKTRIPVLEYVMVTAGMNGVDLAYTNIDSWHDGHSPACTFSCQTALLKGRLLQKLLRVCNRKGSIAFGFDPIEPSTLIVRHENSYWRMPTLPVASYPDRYWQDNRREREVA